MIDKFAIYFALGGFILITLTAITILPDVQRSEERGTVKAASTWQRTTQQQRMLDFSPTPEPPSASAPQAVTTPKVGGPNGVDYCIDDHDPDMCDDNTSYLVPKGTGGVTGPCGTVIEQTHKLVDVFPQYMKGLRDQLTTSVSNCGYTTGPTQPGEYVSTDLVIDAYNLAGFKELSKTNANHVSPTGLLNWWKSGQPGYDFIPYSPQVIQDFGTGVHNLTGCVIFLQTSTSYHIGIVNALEQNNTAGDGIISILQAGTRMYIDRFPVSSWNIANSSTNQTNTSGVTGFGCHN